MTITCFEVYAPLQQFNWNGRDFQLGSEVWIKRFDKRHDLHGLDSYLARDEQQTLFRVRHWLTFQWPEGVEPRPAEVVNIALLSLWLSKPTRTNIAFRFELGPGVPAKSMIRLLDRFTWIPNVVYGQFKNSDLQSAAIYFPLLCGVCQARARLNNALYLTLAGCYSHQWQPALICFAAAAEAILTYETGRGITNRLSTSYACFVETQQAERDKAFQEFRSLYEARSDIMHGRSHNIPPVNRIPTLARFGNLLRKLWYIVLLSSQLHVFEGTDEERKKYFLTLRAGYRPPPK